MQTIDDRMLVRMLVTVIHFYDLQTTRDDHCLYGLTECFTKSNFHTLPINAYVGKEENISLKLIIFMRI